MLRFDAAGRRSATAFAAGSRRTTTIRGAGDEWLATVIKPASAPTGLPATILLVTVAEPAVLAAARFDTRDLLLFAAGGVAPGRGANPFLPGLLAAAAAGLCGVAGIFRRGRPAAETE